MENHLFIAFTNRFFPSRINKINFENVKDEANSINQNNPHNDRNADTNHCSNNSNDVASGINTNNVDNDKDINTKNIIDAQRTNETKIDTKTNNWVKNDKTNENNQIPPTS